MTKLADNFKHALQLYLSDPGFQEYRNQLVLMSCRIFEELAIKKDIIEPDKYMDILRNCLEECSLSSLKLSQEKSQTMAKFIRELPSSDDGRVRASFHLLNMAHCFYMRGRFISSHEDAIRSQLFSLQHAVTKLGDTYSAKTMKEASEQLNMVVDYHFSLSTEAQKENYPILLATVKDIFSQSKHVVERDIVLKTIVHNILAAITGLGVFYAVYLVATARHRNSFFLQPDNCLVIHNATEGINALQDRIASAQDIPGR